MLLRRVNYFRKVDPGNGEIRRLYPGAEDEDALIAHNEDGPPELDGHCRWLTVTQANGTKFSTFHYPGMLPGHTFSVNSHGLVQTINNIRVSLKDRKSVV